MSKPFHRPHDTPESRLKETVFLVEATHNEAHYMWRDYAKNSRDRIVPEPGFSWEQVSPGWMVEVGQLDNRPVCINLQWNSIEGRLVCFWEPTSQVVDHEQIRKWFDERYGSKWDGGTRSSRCDAANFHHCIDAIIELNSTPARPKE